MLTSSISSSHRLLAYSFAENSGLNETGNLSGQSNTLFSQHGIVESIGMIVLALIALVGIMFLVLTIYGGITWMIAEGDEAKVEKAKKIITNSVIGLVIIFAAYAISYFVISALTK
jgi:hypothetical protein